LAWWASFLNTLISGFLTIVGLPTPTEKLVNLVGEILQNQAVIDVLSTTTGQAMLGGTMPSIMKVLHDFGYLSTVIWLAVSTLTWWGAAHALSKIIAYVSPVPNPMQAVYIANSASAVAQLVVLLAQYKGKCGEGLECAF
jgi:hypothetical protein